MDHVNGVVPGPINEDDLSRLSEAVCIQTEKIYDSCKEKDCIEDAPVLFRCHEKIQKLLSVAINVKCRRAIVCDVYADVEPVPFKKGFYTVDVKFFIKVTLDFFIPKHGCGTHIVTVPGVVVFDKKVILFGSEGGVRIFKTHYTEHGIDTPVETALQQDNLPISKVEVAEPICLSAKIVDLAEKCCDCCCIEKVPAAVVSRLDDNIDDLEEVARVDGDDDNARREVQVSVGLFSIVKLVRYVQLLIPAFDFCVPSKKCVASTEDNPCELFDTIEFPVDEFFPPQKFDFPGAVEEEGIFRQEEDEQEEQEEEEE